MQDSEDLVARERAYHAFNILIRWAMVHLGSLIVWLTLWFATPAGFLGATVVGLAVFTLGYIFLVRHEEHQPLDPWVEGR
jgi:hypothetical protein